MKVFAQGYVFKEGGLNSAWEPLSYVLSLPISTVITGCDSVGQLEENVAIAKSFKKLPIREMQEMERKTKSYVRRAQFFRKKYGGYDSRDKLED
jgi:aryl-alcohol dehydrogenase-like predicted oxidoreductase